MTLPIEVSGAGPDLLANSGVEGGGGAVSQSATTILDDVRMLVNCSLELTTTGAFDMVSEGRPGVDIGAANEEMAGAGDSTTVYVCWRCLAKVRGARFRSTRPWPQRG